MPKSKFLRHRSRTYNSPEERKKRSDKARKGAIAANKTKAEKREPVTEPLECYMRHTVENLRTGKVTVVTYHEGTRKNNVELRVDGRNIGVLGHIAALSKILKNIYTAALTPAVK